METRPPQSSSHARFETLDGMRGIAAVCVMIFHFTQFCTPRPLASSALAVDLFFMLSGFVIVHSYGRSLRNGMSASLYLAKRIIRLHPTYVIGVLLGAPVLYWMHFERLTDAPPNMIATSILANAFYLPFPNEYMTQVMGSGEFTGGKFFLCNPPAWSLFYEVLASIAFLGLVRLKRTALAATVAVSFVLYLICGTLQSHFDSRFSLILDIGWGMQNFPGGFPRVIYGFALGMLIYSLTTDHTLDRAHVLTRRYITSSYLVYFLLVLVFLFPGPIRGAYDVVALLLLAPCLLYIGSVVPCVTPAALKTAQFLGWISFPLYCFHFPIGRAVFMASAHLHAPKSIAVVVSIILSVLLAAALTKLIDEPLRAFLSTKLAGSKRTPLVPQAANVIA